MPRCTSRYPERGLQCARTVAHSIHANCSLWWDDQGNCGREAAWPREVPPLFPTVPTVTQ